MHVEGRKTPYEPVHQQKRGSVHFGFGPELHPLTVRIRIFIEPPPNDFGWSATGGWAALLPLKKEGSNQEGKK